MRVIITVALMALMAACVQCAEASPTTDRIRELCKLDENKDAQPCVKRQERKEKAAAKREERAQRELSQLKGK